MAAYSPKDVSVHMEASPNPHSLKFVVSTMLLPAGLSFDFPTADSAADAPLARELFTYAFVLRVFYMDNFITITKKEGIEWIEIQHTLSVHIKNFIAGGQAIISDSALAKSQKGQDIGAVKKIKTILDEYVRPAVQQDGGGIIFHSYIDGVVKVHLQGACKGCPAATATLKTGIENIFKKMMPDEVRAVEAVD